MVWRRKREPYVSSFWSGAFGTGQSQQNEGGVSKGGECFGDPVKDFFKLMVMNESHAVVFGPTGAGKTRFIDNALSNLGNILPSHTVVVLDVTGGYEGYTDYHAPYPLNVVRELNPVILPRVLGEVFRIDGDENAITPTMAQNLETLASWLLGMEPPPQGFDASKYPRNLGGLIAMAKAAVNEGVIQGNLVESVYALIRRLNLVRHWMVDSETHPMIRRIVGGELRGKSIGIDLSVFEDEVLQQWFYIIALLRILSKRTRNLIVVIDEAHLFLQTPAATLARFVRMGRNFGRYVVMISQAPSDFPSWVFTADKIFVEFPIAYLSFKDLISEYPSYKYAIGDREPGIRVDKAPEHWSGPHRARVHIHAMTDEAWECLGSLTIMPVEVDVKVPPKPNAVTLRRCAEKYGVPLDLVREYGFDTQGKGDVLRGVWECIGM